MKKIFLSLISVLMCTASAWALTPVFGAIQSNEDQAYQFISAHTPNFDRNISKAFFKYGEKYGIRGDIAICQAIIETGWFQYTGGTAVTPDQHNYGGIGVTSLGVKGESYPTVDIGVEAMIQHIWSYATAAGLPAGCTLYDTRFAHGNRGKAPYWEQFGKSGSTVIWAGTVNYGYHILSMYNELINYKYVPPVPPLDLQEVWHHRQSGGSATAQSYDATKVRNMCYFNGRLFCTYEGNRILVLNAKSGLLLGELNTEGISGGAVTLADVREFSGSIIASNISTSTSSPLKVYRWRTVNSKPELVLSTTNFGGATRLGDCIGVGGDWTNGKLIFAQDDNSTSRIVSYKVSNGTVSTTPTTVNATKNGSYFSIGISPRVTSDGDGYFACGKNCGPARLNSNGSWEREFSLDCKWGNSFAEFAFSDQKYLAAMTFLNGSGNYSDGVLAVYNITDGWDKAALLSTFPKNANLGANINSGTTTSLSVEYDAGKYAYIWAQSTNQGIACYRVGPAPDDCAVRVGEDPRLFLIGTVNDMDWAGSATVGIEAPRIKGKNYATIVSKSGHNSFAFTESQGDWWEAASNRWTGTAEPINANAGTTYDISYQPNSGNRFDLPTGKYYTEVDTKAGTMKVSNRPFVFYIALNEGDDNGQKYRTDDASRAVFLESDGKYRAYGVKMVSHLSDGSICHFSLSTIVTHGSEDWGVHGLDRWGAGTSTRETLSSGRAARCEGGVDDACYYIAPGTYDVVIDIDNKTITFTKTYPKEIFVGGQAYGNNGWFIDKDHVVPAYNAGNGKYYATVTSNGDSQQRFAFIDAPNNNCHRFSSGVDFDRVSWGSTKTIKEEENTKTNGCFSIPTKGTYYLELDLANNTMKVSDKPNVFFLFYDTSIGGNQSWNTESMAIPITKVEEGLFSAHQVNLTKPFSFDVARFSFTTTPGGNPEDWTRVKYDRWGNSIDTYTLTNDVAASFKQNPEGVLQIKPDMYRVSIDLNKGTVKLTADQSGVEDIRTVFDHQAMVIADKGEISVLGNVKDVEVYSISGGLISKGRTTVQVPTGVYIVRVDGKATKVSVK